MPRLPEEDSTTVETPGTNCPVDRACSIIERAARSLMEPPGLNRSHLPWTRKRSGGNSRSRATSGVAPIVATMSGAAAVPGSRPASAGVAVRGRGEGAGAGVGAGAGAAARGAAAEEATVIPVPFC